LSHASSPAWYILILLLTVNQFQYFELLRRNHILHNSVLNH
jgi:hypothetical protein